jgi:predicted nucleotidyltransferase
MVESSANVDNQMLGSISSKEPLIASLCLKHKVRRLELVGSAARDADFNTSSSDADFLVVFSDEGMDGTIKAFFDFRKDLEDLIGLPVDLVEAGAVRNPYVAAQFRIDSELVYEA